MKITYSSNNSGGGWWLKDEDWKALEKAGWFCVWGQYYFCGSNYTFNEKHPKGNKEECADNFESCPGHRRFNSWKDVEKYNGRYMDALTKEASKEFDSVQEALKEFEEITGQSVMAEGCNCCGAPHSFQWEDAKGKNEYCSGEECGEYLFGEKARLTKRELLERLK